MLKIFNTKTSKKEEFKSLKKDEVKMYVCGPTVYDTAHLGHGRSAVAFDFIRKYFIYKGYKMTFVSNYTDIDDKMINRANKEEISVKELAEKIIPEYEKDYGDLNIMSADIQTKATDYIDAMIELIKILEEKGFTYVLDDGVYFDISKFKDYGKFSKQNLEDLKLGARIEVKKEKRNPYDFVLWKFKKENESFWISPWGDGRPGWHIECSAMSFKILGEKFDIHGGGLDLKFPHHECEVAQSVAAFGKNSFAQYWLHNGFINIDNEKMSKSLGNFFTLKDVFKKYDPLVVRFLFLQTHYRNPINFSEKLLDQAKSALSRLHDFVRRIENLKLNSSSKNEFSFIKDFEKFMDNDFDISGALGVIFEMIKKVNFALDKGEKNINFNQVLEELKKIDFILGVIFVENEKIGQDIENLIKERNDARKNKDFAKADEIRDKLISEGIILEDTPEGTIWKKN